MREDRLDRVRAIVDTKLVRDRQQQRVGLGDRLVLLELLDQRIRLRRIGAAEDRAGARVDEADLVLAAALAAEIGAVAIVDQREDAAADGDAGLTGVAGFLPRSAIVTDLRGLLHMEGFAG